MKTIAFNLSCLLLMLVSFSVFADKITITGEPTVLEQRNGVYYTPEGYTTTGSYNYVTVNGEKRVCFAEKQPSLASLDLMALSVNVGGDTVTWNCYPYNTEYFVVTP